MIPKKRSQQAKRFGHLPLRISPRNSEVSVPSTQTCVLPGDDFIEHSSEESGYCSESNSDSQDLSDPDNEEYLDDKPLHQTLRDYRDRHAPDRAPTQQSVDADSHPNETSVQRPVSIDPQPAHEPETSLVSERLLPEPAKKPTLTHLRQSPAIRYTISEDQSCESEVSRRRLLAFNVLKDQRTQLHNANKSKARDYHSPERGSLRLQDYQMQLMLLEQQNKKRLMMARQEADSLGSTPRGEQDHADNTLQIAIGVISRSLGLVGDSKLTLERLRCLVSEDAVEDNVDPPLPRYQVIHRVSQYTDKRMYLDKPHWIEGAYSARDSLVGNLPVRDIHEYLTSHSEVCCVIYRDYDVIQQSDDQKGENTPAIPNHQKETLEPVTELLSQAIVDFIKHHGFADQKTDMKLEAPYVCFYHTRGEALERYLETLEEDSRNQLQIVIDYVLSQFEEEYRTVDEMFDRGKIISRYIDYLFKPGDVVVEGREQNVRGYLNKYWLQVSSKPKNRPKSSNRHTALEDFSLDCWHLGFDGMFSRVHTQLHLAFDITDVAEKCIDNLNIRPLRYANKAAKSKLEQRGDWIWKCRTRCMVSYEENPGAEARSHEERYMIDMMMYQELHQDKASAFTTVNELSRETLKQESPPTGEFAYLMPPTIKGFHLKRKKWLELQVDRMRPIIWNTQAFERLVMKEKTKRLIRALITDQIETENSTDLIGGKGNGLILLLHGGPGTGKTLTAESVAEIAQKPLYPVTCGDIGTEPEDVETYLESVLHIGKTWGCVVLLDEADVFLEQRSLEDLRRNALVSVFLRVLEYYDGILVLTSNRVGTFDEAFKSRIQLAVHYENLDFEQRYQIWTNFINRLEELKEKGVNFVDLRDNIKKLAAHQMNGREIRNVITTARQYARWERKQPEPLAHMLDYEVMNNVLVTTREFDQYIQDVHGGFTSDELAVEDRLRRIGKSTA